MRVGKQYQTWIIFAVCSAVFILINTWTIKDGHNWGDDFSQYIRHAQNIAEGRPYAGRIMLEPWVVSPPGFPLLLVPLIKIFGLNFPVLKWLNVLLWQLYAVIAFLLARDKLGEKPALWISLFLMTSPWFFVFKQNVLSDIPFLFFITAALYAAEKYFDGGRKEYLAFAMLAGGYALLIRWAGVGFFAAWLFYIFVKKSGKETAPIVMGSAAAAVVLQVLAGSSAAAHLKELSIPFGDLVVAIGKYIPGVFGALFEFILTPGTVFSQPLHIVAAKIPVSAALIALAGIVFTFAYRVWKQQGSFLTVFAVIYLLGMFLWPIKGAEGRYITPLVLPVMILGLEGLRTIRIASIDKNFLIGLVSVMLILHNCLVIALNFDFNDNMIYSPGNREMARWIKDHTREDERFMFAKPRALGLMTDRMGVTFGITPYDMVYWWERIGPYGIDYLIMSKEHQAAYIAQVESRFAGAVPVWENSMYTIFKVHAPEEK